MVKDVEPSWHPIMSAVEIRPGMWRMMAQFGRCYATIKMVRRGDEVGYRVDGEDGQLLGYYTTLRGSARAAHTTYIAGHGPRGAANAIVSDIDRQPAPIGIYGRSPGPAHNQTSVRTPDRTKRD